MANRAITLVDSGTITKQCTFLCVSCYRGGGSLSGYAVLSHLCFPYRLPQVLVATAVFCSWMMWTIVYIGQMYPLVSPVLSG